MTHLRLARRRIKPFDRHAETTHLCCCVEELRGHEAMCIACAPASFARGSSGIASPAPSTPTILRGDTSRRSFVENGVREAARYSAYGARLRGDATCRQCCIHPSG